MRALCLAFLDNLALSGSYEAGVLWTDTRADKLTWTSSSSTMKTERIVRDGYA